MSWFKYFVVGRHIWFWLLLFRHLSLRHVILHETWLKILLLRRHVCKILRMLLLRWLEGEIILKAWSPDVCVWKEALSDRSWHKVIGLKRLLIFKRLRRGLRICLKILHLHVVLVHCLWSLKSKILLKVLYSIVRHSKLFLKWLRFVLESLSKRSVRWGVVIVSIWTSSKVFDRVLFDLIERRSVCVKFECVWVLLRSFLRSEFGILCNKLKL